MELYECKKCGALRLSRTQILKHLIHCINLPELYPDLDFNNKELLFEIFDTHTSVYWILEGLET